MQKLFYQMWLAMNKMFRLIDKLEEQHSLSVEEYTFLLENLTEEAAEYLKEKAVKARKTIYGNAVFVRGLIEISNICRNDCLYCGIRRSNKNCDRYRLTEKEILSCCEKGYSLGFRTFVLQSGEDGCYTDDFLVELIKKIKLKYPECAVTLSSGERRRESYKALYDAGADRYLLRHEAKNEELYKKLHPENMSLDNRLKCLEDLKEIGYQVGCGFMVGAPYQTLEHIAEDLKFIEEFKPEMCGIGPFVSHKATVFKDYPNGSRDLTCSLLSIIRLINPRVLLPATTALGTISGDGRERGILSGANVIMPNLSPENAKKKYDLYDNKLNTGLESGENLEKLKMKIIEIGYEIVIDRGDYKKEN